MTSYLAYEVARLLNDDRRATATANALRIIHFEKLLDIFGEPWLQRETLEYHWAIPALDWFYLYAHIPALLLFLSWVYLRRHEAFAFIRNCFLILNGFAVALFIVVPVAPPRLVSSSGLTDTLLHYSDTNYDRGPLARVSDPFAAMPSLHFAYALFIALGLALLTRRNRLRAMPFLYPAVMLEVIVATGNHFLFDALVGGLITIAGYLLMLTQQLASPGTVASDEA